MSNGNAMFARLSKRPGPITKCLRSEQYFRSWAPLRASQSAPDARSRMDRVINRVPRVLHRFVIPLREAPLTHISSFLVLHEITAIAPLFALVGIFHYTRWMPPYISEGKWFSDGMERFGRYARKKGWLKDEDGKRRLPRLWGRGEKGARLLAEFATAYAITKVLLPARLIFSVWATPWFARIAMVPLLKRAQHVWMRLRGQRPPMRSGAAGTGATGAGVVTKKPADPGR